MKGNIKERNKIQAYKFLASIKLKIIRPISQCFRRQNYFWWLKIFYQFYFISTGDNSLFLMVVKNFIFFHKIAFIIAFP